MKKFKIFSLLLLITAFSCHVRQSLSSGGSRSDDDGKRSSGKIAIAAVGNNEDSKISSIAGRAPYYLIFDEKGTFLKSIQNPAQSTGGGASSGVVSILLRESCKTFIAGKFGYKMETQLKANNIEYYIREGIAKQVVQTF